MTEAAGWEAILARSTLTGTPAGSKPEGGRKPSPKAPGQAQESGSPGHGGDHGCPNGPALRSRHIVDGLAGAGIPRSEARETGMG